MSCFKALTHVKSKAADCPKFRSQILGCFSFLLEGKQCSTGREVALKLIPQSSLGPREYMNLVRETEALKLLYEEPHITQLLQVLNDVEYKKKGPHIMLVMELCHGGELFDFMLYSGTFGEVIGRTYFQQLIGGLVICHEKKIFHRDIKPENLLLDCHFQLKIADFGLSALLKASNQKLFTQCGTKSYMAPEVLSSPDGYDGALADIWSCGVVLFIMLAGFPPFQIAAKQDWWFRALATNNYDAFWAAHERTCTFSNAAKSLLSSIFVIDPSKRCSLAEIQQHPWYNQETLSAQPLFEELSKRKQAVDSQKNNVAKESSCYDNEDYGAIEFDPFEQNVTRSIPIATPNFVKKAVNCNNGAVCRYTCFYSKATEKNMQQSLENLFHTMKVDYLKKENQLVWKARCAGAGMISFSVEITPQEHTDLLLVEFIRKSGDCFSFQTLYKECCGKLTSLICDKPYCDKVHTEEEYDEEELISDEAQMI